MGQLKDKMVKKGSLRTTKGFLKHLYIKSMKGRAFVG